MSSDIASNLALRPELFTSLIGFQVQRQSGRQWECDCPDCGGKKKLTLNIDNSTWICHKCGSKGNAVTYYAKTHNVDNKEAFKQIMQALGLWEERKEKPQKKKSSKAAPKPEQTKSLPPAIEPASGREPIYERLLEMASLLPEDRENLKQHRGFSDELIRDLRFSSCGPHLAEVIRKMREEYAEEILLDAGILADVKGNVLPNKQLLEPRLLIPYLDVNGQVYHLRPHKLGFKGLPPEPYSRQLVQGKPDHVVLTEGEFKAAALRQWGFPAVAVPGISSFGVEHLPRLVGFLEDHGVKKVTVIFDSEEKDNPDHKNYKANPSDRWDTQYWSYQMAVLLRKAGFQTKVGWLPEAWRVEGKVDFDMALAQGRTREEIGRVLYDARLPEEFRKNLPGEGKRIIERKLAQQFAKKKVKRDWNRYLALRFSRGGIDEEPISNFVITIEASLYQQDTVVRSVTFTNQYGERSETYDLEPASMAGVAEFRKFVLSKGNYLFSGNAEDLQNIWEFEFLRDSGKKIYLPEQIGRIKKDLWLFGNLAIHQKKVVYPDDDGTMWITTKDGQQIGYRAQSINATGGKKDEIDPCLPILSCRGCDIKTIAAKLRQSVGGYEANMLIGWVVASIFSDDIYRKYRALPILFPYGKRSSGKSTAMRWAMAFFGLEDMETGLAKTSANSIVRLMSYYSSLGVWFDEYRNDREITDKDGLFRSAFNRQATAKGTPTAFQTKSFRVRSTVAIAGEELPRDSGLFTRLIPLQFSAYKRDREPYQWLNEHRSDFSGFAFDLILRYDELLPKVLRAVSDFKEALVAKGIADRTAENWAICGGAYFAAVEEDPQFVHWILDACQVITSQADENHMLAIFWDDINVMLSDNTIDTGYFRTDGENVLSIWYAGLHGKWAEYYRRRTGKEPFSQASLLQYLQAEPYYLGTKKVRIKGTPRPAHQVDGTEAPESIQEIFQLLKTSKPSMD